MIPNTNLMRYFHNRFLICAVNALSALLMDEVPGAESMTRTFGSSFPSGSTEMNVLNALIPPLLNV